MKQKIKTDIKPKKVNKIKKKISKRKEWSGDFSCGSPYFTAGDTLGDAY